MPASTQGAKKSISVRLKKLPLMTKTSQREKAASELDELVDYLYENLKTAIEERDDLAKKMEKIKRAIS